MRVKDLDLHDYVLLFFLTQVNLILPSRNIIAEEDYESPDHSKNNIRSISVSSNDRSSQLLLSMILVSIVCSISIRSRKM